MRLGFGVKEFVTRLAIQIHNNTTQARGVAHVVYLIQSFSRSDDGALRADPPCWSRDRAFAAALSQALGRRKAGVVAIGATLDAEGCLDRAAGIIAATGEVPTELLVPSILDVARAPVPIEPAGEPIRLIA